MKKSLWIVAMLVLMACTDDQDVLAQTEAKGTVERDITIHSIILGRDMKYSVYLPAGYTTTKQYPVLYLLHGYGGDQNDWWEYDDIAYDADAMIAAGEIPEMIIVTPDGRTWMYIDNCYGNGINYEQYFFEELIEDVETRYSIRRDRGSRAIGGFSMGGYGALRYGVMHNELFCYVYAIATALGIMKASPNWVNMALVAAMGAIQLATAIAQPIKAYKEGTKSKPHPGGLAVVGDGGQTELVMYGKRVWLTPDTPTLVDLPKGAEVFPQVTEDDLALLGASLPMAIPRDKTNGMPVIINDYSALEDRIAANTKAVTKALSRHEKALTRELKNQRFAAYLARRL